MVDIEQPVVTTLTSPLEKVADLDAGTVRGVRDVKWSVDGANILTLGEGSAAFWSLREGGGAAMQQSFDLSKAQGGVVGAVRKAALNAAGGAAACVGSRVVGLDQRAGGGGGVSWQLSGGSIGGGCCDVDYR